MKPQDRPAAGTPLQSVGSTDADADAHGAAPAVHALYAGRVTHQRLRPLRHRLRYRVFSLLLDVDGLPALARRLRLFSLNRFNLFSLHERDYGSGAGGLRAHVDAQLRAGGLATGGAIRLLTMPRVLGYAFNPLNVYFCEAPSGGLNAILYEVNNTFGERHSYLIEVDPAAAGQGTPIEQTCAKRLHVSPFMALDMRYAFRVEPPDTRRRPLAIGVVAHDSHGPVLAAHYHAQRQPLNDGTLARTLISHPLLTFKVILAIHWEALRLFAKGLRLLPKPPPPVSAVTVVKPGDA